MKKRVGTATFRQRFVYANFVIPHSRHMARIVCIHISCAGSQAVLVGVGLAHIVTNSMAFPDIFNDPLYNDEVKTGDGCAFWGLLSLAYNHLGGSSVERKVIMSDNTDMLIRLSERIRSATSGTTELDAKEVASILCEIEDISARRMILARFMASACSRGDVSEAVAWTVVMSHMERCRPSADVQLEAMHLINAH